MAVPAAAPVAGVYVAGAALVAGAAWLMTPAGQRASQSFGEAVYEGGASAVDNIKSLFEGDEDKTQSPPISTTTTNTTTRGCDGPHQGRIQVQGYMKNVDPHPIEISWPWTRPCVPPLRPEGLAAISDLLIQTQNISVRSAGVRAKAFSKMSKYIARSPVTGFFPHSIGWGVTPNFDLRINKRAGRNAPRVDLEVKVGRAFGDR